MDLVFTFILLFIFQIKHFMADYLLQNQYMLGKFKKGTDYIAPLAAHCGVHAAGTLMICFLVYPSFWWLSIFDFCSHFVIDRIKASPDLLGRWKPDKPIFWKVLGLDQMAHHLVHYIIIFILLW